VRFEEGFARRLEALSRRLAAVRDRRESGGSARAAGGATEFVGYRPYAAGDDPRSIDWDLVARSRRAWVKVSRREAGDRWLVALDASASMGVGPPGKLQRAAEVAAGIAAQALAAGAEARIVASPGGRELGIARRQDLARLLAFLETLRAQGAGADRAPPRVEAEVARVFVVGDLRGADPESLLALRRRGRELKLLQILAPVEISPPPEGSVEWWDPEAGDALALEIDARARVLYAAELAGEIERWRSACARSGVAYSCSSSASPFEEILGKSAGA
jgi:uncharacterized protein (DUF58 family)